MKSFERRIFPPKYAISKSLSSLSIDQSCHSGWESLAKISFCLILWLVYSLPYIGFKYTYSLHRFYGNSLIYTLKRFNIHIEMVI